MYSNEYNHKDGLFFFFKLHIYLLVGFFFHFEPTATIDCRVCLTTIIILLNSLNVFICFHAYYFDVYLVILSQYNVNI